MKPKGKNPYNFNEHVLNVIRNSGVIKGRKLAEIFGHKDTRKIRLAIEQLRREGEPICIGKSGGYFYSKNKDDIDYTIKDFLSRAKKLMSIAEGMSMILENKESCKVDTKRK